MGNTQFEKSNTPRQRSNNSHDLKKIENTLLHGKINFCTHTRMDEIDLGVIQN